VGYLRILLALSVAVGHLQSHIYGAPDSTIIFIGPVVAVKMFFIISGFYMAMIYSRHYSAKGAFWISRAARLFPAYWMTMAFCIAVTLLFKTPNVGPLINLDFWYLVRDPIALLLITLSNLTFLGIDFGFITCVQSASVPHFVLTLDAQCPSGYALLVERSVVPPAWTLSLEWYFYLIVPMVSRWKTRSVAFLAGCSFVLALAISIFANFNPWHRSFFPAELYLFLLGFLAFRLKDAIPRPVATICTPSVVAIILLYQHIPILDWLNPAGLNIALYLAFAMALPTLFAYGNYLPGERLVGDLSYPIYICHGAVETVLLALLLHNWVSLEVWVFVNVVTITSASALLLRATAPAERFRMQFKSTSPPMSSLPTFDIAAPIASQIANQAPHPYAEKRGSIT
jgi:peptidoglycan/LPS O-acetylase OafA/YrhL